MAVTLAGDWDEYASGPYRLVNNVWNQGGLRNGPDFTQSVTYEPGTFPDGVTLRWSWPGFNERIWAYPEVVVGYKPWDPHDPALDFAARVDAVRELEARFDLAIAGDTGKFNVALEFWLTDKAGGGPQSITTEVMVWLHNGGLTPAGRKVGRYDDDGYGASVFVQKGMGDRSGESGVKWKYVALEADADLLSGAIDLRAVLVALRKAGIVDGRDYIGGFELGAEVAGGKGSLRIDALDHTVSAYAITEGGDTLVGTGRGDLIDGRGGADVMTGLGGRDHLQGSGGHDALSGGPGGDRLEGGGGRDRFVFDAGLGKGNQDRIVDFRPGKDTIVLDGTIFAGIAPGKLARGAFHRGEAATGSEHRIIHDGKRGIISFDHDGAGGDAAIVFARVDRGIELGPGDFVLG